MSDKAMTLRITDEQHAGLTWIAKLNGTSVTAEVRTAVANYIENRRRDPRFQERLRRHRAEQEAIYDRLAATPSREQKR